MSPIGARTLLKESLDIGTILFVTYTVGAVMNTISAVGILQSTGDFIRSGFVLAGTAIAILYVLVQSVSLAHTLRATGTQLTPSTTQFVREAVILSIPVILWFTVAGLSTMLQVDSTLNAAIETIVLASTRTGLLTAILYVLARGIALLPRRKQNASGFVSTDD
jgi:hypothetical protein